MNRPFFRQTDEQKSDTQYRTERRGLASAEEIVTLILRRYGLDQDVLDESTESVELHTEDVPPLPVVTSEPSPLQQQSFCWD